MVNSTPIKDTEPPTATVTAEIMQQFIEQNQKLMQLLSANNKKSGRKWTLTNFQLLKWGMNLNH